VDLPWHTLLRIQSISVSEFTPGEIAKLSVEIENGWNQEIDSLSLDMQVRRGDEIAGSYTSEEFSTSQNQNQLSIPFSKQKV